MVQNRREHVCDPSPQQRPDSSAGIAAERDVVRVLNLLATAEKVLKDDVGYSKVPESEPATVEASAAAAQQALAVGWPQWSSGDKNIDTARMTALMLQLGSMRSSLRTSRAVRRDDRMFGLSTFLHNLRLYTTVPDLLDRVPTEVNRLGLTRVLVSRVVGGQWIARSAAVVGHMELAQDMVRVGTEHPGTLTGGMIETEMVRRRAPILVHEAVDNPRVHPQLRSLIDCRAYVSAPILVSGKVAGLVHADRNAETGTVDESDRDLIGTVAEALGFAVERTMFHERLRGLRRQLDDHHRVVREFIDEFAEGEGELWPESGSPAPAPSTPPSGPRTDDGICLTRREIEVLRHMALGQTNAQIASALFVSEGTVKTHAKHILRKLGAANRAEAVSRYHLMSRKG